MSLANRTAQPIGHPPTLCPYCAHVSPLDSKFCNECGAALHLLPCPQCGSINDITLTADCSRCSCALHVSAFALSDFPDLPAVPPEPELPAVLVAESINSDAAEPPAALRPPALAPAPVPVPVHLQDPAPEPVSIAELAFDTSSARSLSPLLLLQRSRALLVGGVLLIAAAAAAAYLLMLQREESGTSRFRAGAASSAAPTSGRVTGPGPVVPVSRSAANALLEPTAAGPLPGPPPGASAVQAAPLAQPVLTAVTITSAASRAAIAPALAASSSVLKPPQPAAAGRLPVLKGSSANLNRTWPTTSEAAEIAQAAEAAQLQLRSRARLDAGVGLDLPVPNIGPCTQAVAALGLCAAPVKQIPPP